MSLQFLRRPDVMRLTGLSYTTIWRLERDGKFPRRRQISPNSVGWVAAEVEEWALQRQAVASKEAE